MDTDDRNGWVGRWTWWGRLWVGCGFFSWGDGKGEEETPRKVLMSRFRRTTRVSQHLSESLCYIDQWGFTTGCVRPSRTVSPILDTMGRHVPCSSCDNLMTLPHPEDSEGAGSPRSTTDSTEQWVWLNEWVLIDTWKKSVWSTRRPDCTQDLPWLQWVELSTT